MEGTAVTGQTVVVSTTVSVTVAVVRASVGSLVISSVLVGQSITSGRHEMTVWTEVVDTVRVVRPVPVVVREGAALVTTLVVSGEPSVTVEVVSVAVAEVSVAVEEAPVVVETGAAVEVSEGLRVLPVMMPLE